ncbi:MAG: DUF2460 domain-containing protein [Hungatella sp.]|nr:DUF2460 domain-containing protein [Hungatella sp.]
MRKLRLGSFPDLLFLLFAAGSIIGCVTANLLSKELLKQIGYFDSIYQWESSMGREERRQFWSYTARRRFLEVGTGALVGMTPLARGAFGGIAMAFGFGLGLLISTFTLERGWMGIFLFLKSVMPQWIFYGLGWVILAAGCDNGLEKAKLRMWLLLVMAVLAGTLLEVFFNFR